LAHEQGAPKQVGPDFHAVETELVARGANTHTRAEFPGDQNSWLE
jgi:hypothetical protein